MSDKEQIPFSARSRGAHHQVSGDFPPSARSGLLHLLFDLVERDFVRDWSIVTRELQRTGRLSPVEYDMSKLEHIRRSKNDAEAALAGLEWEKVFDFCERLHGHLAVDVGYQGEFGFQIVTPRADVQAYIAGELQRLFVEERLAYVFTDGHVRRRGRKHSDDVAERASHVLGDPELQDARRHYSKALQFFRHPTKPDYENAVKESVCAVEAAAKALFPEAKATTLGDFSKWLSRSETVDIPKGLIQTITGMYAYRSGGSGVGHGGATGGNATAAVAEFVLAVCASQVIYLVDVANKNESNIPF